MNTRRVVFPFGDGDGGTSRGKGVAGATPAMPELAFAGVGVTLSWLAPATPPSSGLGGNGTPHAELLPLSSATFLTFLFLLETSELRQGVPSRLLIVCQGFSRPARGAEIPDGRVRLPTTRQSDCGVP